MLSVRKSSDHSTYRFAVFTRTKLNISNVLCDTHRILTKQFVFRTTEIIDNKF